MRTGIIDIGSNTIKAFVYDCDKTDIVTAAHEKYYALLYSETENGKMSKKGIELIARCCVKALAFLNAHNCGGVYAFATAAVRASSNKDEIAAAVKNAVNLKLDILSGEDEAMCDYLSLKYLHGFENGVSADLGGGSCQINVCDGGSLVQSMSLPLGALKLKNQFVADKYAAKDENNKMKEYISSELSVYTKRNFEEIYFMGGSAYSLLKIDLLNNMNRISAASLADVRAMLENLPDKESYLKARVPGREYTFPVGLVVIECIMDYFSCETLRVVPEGVREGYIFKTFLQLQ